MSNAPVPLLSNTSVREYMRNAATKKALKAFHRHGEESYQFKKALRSRWLNWGSN